MLSRNVSDGYPDKGKTDRRATNCRWRPHTGRADRSRRLGVGRESLRLPSVRLDSEQKRRSNVRMEARAKGRNWPRLCENSKLSGFRGALYPSGTASKPVRGDLVARVCPAVRSMRVFTQPRPNADSLFHIVRIREELFTSGIPASARPNGAPQSGRRAGRLPNGRPSLLPRGVAGRLTRRRGAQGVGAFQGDADLDPARAVVTPPHLLAKTSDFYALMRQVPEAAWRASPAVGGLIPLCSFMRLAYARCALWHSRLRGAGNSAPTCGGCQLRRNQACIVVA